MIKLDTIKSSLLISFLGVSLLVWYTTQVSSKKYQDFLIKHIEHEATYLGKHLSRIVIDSVDQRLNKETLAQNKDRIHEQLQLHIQDLGIYKLRIFSPEGEIVYSTDSTEVGTVNTKAYFTDIVAKGNVYTKTALKDNKTFDGDVTKIDVVESYIPIMSDKKFRGALEIYHDITMPKAKLSAVKGDETKLIISFSIGLLFIIIIVSKQSSNIMKKLRAKEQEQKDAYNVVEREVKQRTYDLILSKEHLEKEIEERKLYEEQLSITSRVFDSTMEGIVLTDVAGNIERINDAFSNITGYASSELVGKNPRILKSGKHDPSFYKELWRAIKNEGTWSGEIWNRRKNGEIYPEWLSINAIRDKAGKICNYAGVFHDISEMKETEEKLHYQAYYDALTSLPNRTLFNDRLNMALSYAKRHNFELSVLFIDLDDFKNVNDSLGHYYGDLLLQEVAKRLSHCCREEDTIARISGDEFLMITRYENKSETAAIQIAERVLHSFENQFIIKDKTLHINASLGISIFPHNGKDAEILIKNADAALYKSKEHGKNQYTLFTDDLEQAILRKIDLSNDLREALNRDELEVFYQPKVHFKNGVVVGAEALLRWRRGINEMVSPEEFIPISEEIGIIHEIGIWVMETACRAAIEFNNISEKPFRMAVNVSVKQFQNDDLVPAIKKVLKETGLAPELLTVEITESIVIHDINTTVEILTQLKELGVQLSIDDFGTGYSSLSYLKTMPLSELKIDKSFVDNVPGDQDAESIVKTIISLAKGLKLKTVAEGVETKEQFAYLADNECNVMQGYLFSKPLPYVEMMALLKDGTALEIAERSYEI